MLQGGSEGNEGRIYAMHAMRLNRVADLVQCGMNAESDL